MTRFQQVASKWNGTIHCLILFVVRMYMRVRSSCILRGYWEAMGCDLLNSFTHHILTTRTHPIYFMDKFIKIGISTSEHWCSTEWECANFGVSWREGERNGRISITDYMRDMSKAVLENDNKPIDHGTLKTHINCRSCKKQWYWYPIIYKTRTYSHTNTSQHVKWPEWFKMLMNTYILMNLYHLSILIIIIHIPTKCCNHGVIGVFFFVCEGEQQQKFNMTTIWTAQ